MSFLTLKVNKLQNQEPITRKLTLFLTDNIALIDWHLPFKKLIPEDTRILFENTTISRALQDDDIFVGRREDFARIMPVLDEKRAVMLKGQGGIGKTCMAKKLIQRFKARKPALIPFIFNEEGKGFSLQGMYRQLKDFCLNHEKSQWLKSLEFCDEKMSSRIIFLTGLISKNFDILFLFDNIETFQNNKQGEFTTDNQGVLDIIRFCINRENMYIILTGRYPVLELNAEIRTFDLNDVVRNDFIRKCYHLGLFTLSLNQIEVLFESLGGNFRMLEFFHHSFIRQSENMITVFDSIKSFQSEIKVYTERALQEMTENLIFGELLESLTKEDKKLLEMFYHFQLPVIDVAFRLQDSGNNLHDHLKRLVDLTFIQVYLDLEVELFYYFMPTLVKNLLQKTNPVSDKEEEFHLNAGRYHLYMFRNVWRWDINELDAAFFHFIKTGEINHIYEVGEYLSSIYFHLALYPNALHICQRVEKISGSSLPSWCANQIGMIELRLGQYDAALKYFKADELAFESKGEEKISVQEKKDLTTTLNNMGLLFQTCGNNDTALDYFKKSLKISQEIGNKTSEGTILNNIGQIYGAWEDYDKALDYLNQSLKISEETGNKYGESSALNNISEIYRVKGDYDTALDYLNQSLKISQEIGDLFGEGTTLNNLSQVYKATDDFDIALDYLKKSLSICTRIGDKSGEGRALNNIGQIYRARGDYGKALDYFKKSLMIHQKIGAKSFEASILNSISYIYSDQVDYDNALNYLTQSFKIRQKMGDKSGESDIFNNMGDIFYSRGDYDTALEYFKKSLKIKQEMDDKWGESKLLNKISQIYDARSNYDTALDYLKQSHKINKEIGDKCGESTTLNNIGQIFKARGDYDTALDYLNQSLKISQEIVDKHIGGAPLNNIGLIYLILDNYDTAMDYFKQSLKISQELRDKSGQTYALHNIAMISFKKKNYAEALDLEFQAYRLAQETKDARRLFEIGFLLGRFLIDTGQKNEGIEMLKTAYQVGKSQETKNSRGLFELGGILGLLLIGADEKNEGIEMLKTAYHIGKNAGFQEVEKIKEVLSEIGVKEETTVT